MIARLTTVFALALLFAAGTARAAGAQTCISIDDTRDALTPGERAAAVVLLADEFERAGHAPAPGASDCASPYVLAHLRLGERIIVTLTGPLGMRQATALGVDDLPAIYSQMVRSLVTGEPMGRTPVVDRTNVSAAQDFAPRRVHTDSVWYARLGTGTVFADTPHHSPMFGFGYRAEFDRVGLDLSFLNLQPGDRGGYLGDQSLASSLIKLQGLYFTNPTGDRSAFFGGGLSYGRTEITRPRPETYPITGYGSGLQGELTVGYEFARTTSIRLFAQADVTLPFYRVAFEEFTYVPPVPGVGRPVPPTVTTTHQYAPSVAISVGMGWQKGRR